MKEDLNMQGNDFNVCAFIYCQRTFLTAMQKINTIFTCGYIVGMIPSRP